MDKIVFHKLWAALSGGSRRQKLRLSKQTSIHGRMGFVHTAIDPVGSALIEGELWKAKSSVRIERGANVRVVGTDGVFVRVEPIA